MCIRKVTGNAKRCLVVVLRVGDAARNESLRVDGVNICINIVGPLVLREEEGRMSAMPYLTGEVAFKDATLLRRFGRCKEVVGVERGVARNEVVFPWNLEEPGLVMISIRPRPGRLNSAVYGSLLTLTSAIAEGVTVDDFISTPSTTMLTPPEDIEPGSRKGVSAPTKSWSKTGTERSSSAL